MADIFFSYSRSDLDRVRPLVEALEERGWSVWWDPDIHGGDSWSDVIEAELKQARCVIVAWSARSAESEWVREEARVANQSRKLVPLLLDRMDPPFGFGGLQTLDLSGWAAGQYQAAEFQRLCRSIQTKLVANAVPGLSAPLDAKVSTPAAEKQDRAPEKQDSPTITPGPSRRQSAHSRTEMVLIVLGVASLTGIGWYGFSKMSDRSIDKPSATSTGDYNVTIHFAGDFNRESDIIPFAQKLRAAGWRIQDPTGGKRDKAAEKLCEVRYRASDDRAFAELLAAEVPKTGIAPGRASVNKPLDSAVGAGELQLWIGSGICK